LNTCAFPKPYYWHLLRSKTFSSLSFVFLIWGRRGHDRMVVGFTTTYAISA
jgi:hypothetical protein